MGMQQGSNPMWADPYGVDPAQAALLKRQAQIQMGLGLIGQYNPSAIGPAISNAMTTYRGGLQDAYQLAEKRSADAEQATYRASQMAENSDQAASRAQARTLALQHVEEQQKKAAEDADRLQQMRARLVKDNPAAALYDGKHLEEEYQARYGYHEPDKPKEDHWQIVDRGDAGAFMFNSRTQQIKPAEGLPVKPDKADETKPMSTSEFDALVSQRVRQITPKKKAGQPKPPAVYDTELHRWRQEADPETLRRTAIDQLLNELPPELIPAAYAHGSKAKVNNPATPSVMHFDSSGNLIP